MSQPRLSRETGLNLLIVLALLAGTVGCYWPVRHFEFVNYDDPFYVSQNALVRQGLTWRGVVWAFTSALGGNWNPVVWLSHMLDCQLFGLSAGAHHLSNLVFHCINTVLLFAALKRITGAAWRSAVVAALFAWHPLHVESVAWISERKDLLGALFFLLAIWAYCEYAAPRGAKPGEQNLRAERRPKSEDRIPRIASGTPQPTSGIEHPVSSTWHPGHGRWYLLCLAFFVLGLMSNPIVVTLPLVLLLLDFWPLRRLRRSAQSGIPPALGLRISDFLRPSAPGFRPSSLPPRPSSLVWEKLPFFVLALAGCIVAFWAQGSSGDMRSVTEMPWLFRTEAAVVAWASYALQLFRPGAMAVFYPRPASFLVSQIAVAAVLLVGVSGLAVRLADRAPYLVLGWFWFLGTLAPVIGLVHVGEQWRADRYTYIPSIGLFVAVVWGVAALLHGGARRRAAAAGAGVLVLAACIVCTREQVRYWRASSILFEHAMLAVPGNYLAVNHFGMALLEQGNMESAEDYFRAALLMRWDYGDAHRNLGSVLAKEGRYAEAQAEYEAVVRLHPRTAPAWDDLGKVYASQQRLDEAIRMFSEALRLNPQFAAAHRDLGLAYGLHGELEKCAAELASVVRLAPRDAYARSQLGVALARIGRPEAAAASFKEAVRLAPDSPHYLNQLAWVYATHPKRELRNGAEAVRLAERACKLTQRKDVLFLETLSAAYAEAGRFREASQTAEEARALALARKEQALADAVARKLELYRAGKPYRDQQLPD